MLIKNGIVLNGNTNTFDKTDLLIENGRIAAFGGTAEEVFDAKGLYVIPGFIDTHIHGFAGVEFAKDSGGFEEAQAILAADGTTGFLATVRCMELEDMLAADRNAARVMRLPQARGAKVLGIHNEGPFVSFERSGAMFPPQVECTVQAVQAMIEAGGGQLKLITLAPERENAKEVIAYARERGVTCTMGHTDATFAQATAAVDAGAVRATHVFNAMRPLYHRETGILGVSLTDDRVCCELIADFVHLDPAAVKLVYRAKGAANITLISDAGAHSGLPDGEYLVGGRMRYVKNGLCLNAEGRIAGSCFNMLRGAQNLLKLGIPLEEVSVMASYNPAKAIGMQDTLGSIVSGKQADLIMCDDKLNIHAVFVDGVRQ